MAGLTGLSTTPISTTAQQASALPPGYIDGFIASVPIGSAGTTATVSAGSARDQANTLNLVSASLSFDLAVSGAGGLDTGAIANSTSYWLYVISNAAGTTLNTLASTSATSPTMPTGYTKYVLVDRLRTQGTGKLVETVTSGRGKFSTWGARGYYVSASKTGTFGTPTAVDCSLLTGGDIARHPAVSGGIGHISASADYCLLSTRSGGPLVRSSSSAALSVTIMQPAENIPLESSNIYIDRGAASATGVYVALWSSSFVRGAL